MRTLLAPMVGVALVLAAGGCASTRPCLIIPAQIQLAQEELKQARTDAEAKQAEVTRSKENLDISITRLRQMEEERDTLQKTLAAQAADSAKAGRKAR